MTWTIRRLQSSPEENLTGDQTRLPRHREKALDEREKAIALRERRVGGMDEELLATFGTLPNGTSSASKEVNHISVTKQRTRENQS